MSLHPHWKKQPSFGFSWEPTFQVQIPFIFVLLETLQTALNELCDPEWNKVPVGGKGVEHCEPVCYLRVLTQAKVNDSGHNRYLLVTKFIIQSYQLPLNKIPLETHGSSAQSAALPSEPLHFCSCATKQRVIV